VPIIIKGKPIVSAKAANIFSAYGS